MHISSPLFSQINCSEHVRQWVGSDGNERESRLQISKRLSNSRSAEGVAMNQSAAVISPAVLGELGAGTKKTN